ncbi:hypothetical protein TNCV_2926351 [Trichonephila clavipes]|nr:hypothetical protein TNCV_2926351 [Trichonephila clavipes]
MEEEAEKFYVIKGLKENRSIEIQLQNCSNIEELKEKRKLLDIQEKSKPNRNKVIYPKYPMTRIPHHTDQFAHRQQYGRWNWRNDPSQHPDTIIGSRYNVYSPQLPSPSYHHPFFSLQRRPCIRETNDCHNDQQFCDRMLQLSTPVQKPKKITQYSNLIEHENL